MGLVFCLTADMRCLHNCSTWDQALLATVVILGTFLWPLKKSAAFGHSQRLGTVLVDK
jgi:hypothetical protein